jgi:dihydropyrimidinase
MADGDGRRGHAPDLALRGGRVVTGSGMVEATVAVTGERISAVCAPGDDVPAARVLDVGGAYLLPGAIDPHVHFRVFNAMVDDFETAAAGAAHGGVTTMIPFIGGDERMSVGEGIDHFIAEGSARSVVDFAMHCRLRPVPQLIEQIPEAVRRGVTSIKMFQAYRKRGMLFRDDQLLRGMQLAAASGALAMVHAENGDVIDLLEDQLIARGQTGPEHYLASRPHAAEAEAVSRAIRLAELAGCPLYVVHLSTAAGAQEVAAARARGQAVFGETCPQYLLLTDDEMRRQKGLAKIAPPLRWASDAEALWQALARGSVQTVGSDHAPFTVADKAVGERNIFEAGFGMPGIETLAPLVISAALGSARLSLPQVAQVLAENTARIFGLYPRKGIIQAGADADILVVDPAATGTLSSRQLHSRAGYTCFEGTTLTGRITTTLLRGKVLVENGELRQKPGYGRFLPRPPAR